MDDYERIRKELMIQLDKRGLTEWLKRLPGEYVHAMVATLKEMLSPKT